ncbi:MFS transporter [Streptomyces alboniger]|uniref:MFS transporter n=1 Tax=Streptomyces alboniger TaxID=132473 RepID=A0A5J6HEC1_STRAD|nr:MFS transporter [Streptomyces alboniger]QEV16624.1 MFS transporter [Streptomyces alboniger]
MTGTQTVDDPGRRTARANRFLLLTLALGAFSIGTDSLIISGLLDHIVADLHVSTAAAGQLISVFALLYAVSAPVLAALTARFDRKRLLLAALWIFVAANLLGAVAPTYPMLMASRVVAALGAGLYLPCAMVVAVGISSPERRGRAIATVAGGMSAATALGIPLGTLVGAVGHWRMTLVLVAVLSAAAALALVPGLPRVPSPAGVTLVQRLKAATHPQVLSALVTNTLACAGEFVLFIYIAPLAMGLTGVGAAGVSAFLLVWGVAAMAGSTAGGRASDAWGGQRAYTTAVAVLLAGLCAMVLLSLGQPQARWAALSVFGVLLAVISVASWALPTAQNHRIASLDIPEPTVALSLNGSSSYLGLAIGGAVGGLALAGGSLTALTATAAAFEVLALIALGLSALTTSRTGPDVR